MKRRDFIKTGSAFSLPILLNGLGVQAVRHSALFNHLNINDDRILILIYLGGGNDGLNTLVPLESYDTLANLRPDIILPENTLLPIDNNNAFHPGMTGFRDLYQENNLGIIQGVAYENQNRSHFRSTDIWNTGSDVNTYLKTGWFGRFLESEHPSYPSGYPNEDYPDPLAMTIDYTLSETCQGTAANYSLALVDPAAAASVPEAIIGDYGNDCYGGEYQYILDSIAQSNLYSERVMETYDKGTNLSTKYPEGNRLAQQLKTVARLISGGSKTKIYVLNQGGYDTHANQVEAEDVLTGDHAFLLETLSDAICAFQDDISQLGYGEQVLGMTYSEFGRRIRSNVSLGTDHGTAAPMFLFGECVQGGTLGNNPEINSDVDNQAGVEMQYDYRSVYASVLVDWFGVEESVVAEILFPDFQHLPLLKDCSGTVNNEEYNNEVSHLKLYPNPALRHVMVELDLKKGHYAAEVYSSIGSKVKQIFSRELPSGYNSFTFDMGDLPSGNYVFRLQGKHSVITKRFVKVE